MNGNKKLLGFTLAVIAAIFWGVSGVFGQFVFEQRGMNAEWLVTVRCLSSGIVLLSFGLIKYGRNVFNIWKNRKDVISLLLFSIFGMLAIQYTYFAAIQYSNAATATVLQYTGPAIIAIYLAVRNRNVPPLNEISAVSLVILGTFLLVTHGSFDTLSISSLAFFWGLASAVAFAFYSIQPIRLLSKFSSPIVMGWSMLIAGIAFTTVHAPWNVEGTWDLEMYGSTVFIILFGSVFAFYAYLTALTLIGSQKTSVLASAEPLSATLISVFWLGVDFTITDTIGTLLIISAVFLLTRKGIV